MRSLALALVLAGAASAAHADTITAIIGARAAIGLPADLAITDIHLSPRLAALDVAPTTVDIDFPATARPGRASVRVRIGKRNTFVPVTFAALTDVAVATHPLAPGDVVTPDDVRWERRAATGAAAIVIGAQVSAPIAEGEILDDARLTTPPAIARGTEVDVTVVRGAISISTRGHLEQAARVGATARVRLRGGAYTSGTLVDPGRVRMEAP